jgi:FAD/FMN-containing dehydrogenase
VPTFPHTEVKSAIDWRNFHGTATARVATLFTPEPSESAEPIARLRQHGRALNAIVRHCFEADPPLRLRVCGAGWSFSNVASPQDVLLDPVHLDFILRLPTDWLTPEYRRARPGMAPVFAQGSAPLSRLNQVLAESGLALQTAAASDGQRLAGCIATGSHGSALAVGGLHDTVCALHLITGPDQSVLLQPARLPACSEALAQWLQNATGIPTRSVCDDQLFNAARVSLGSLGIMHGVVVEAVPLYCLSQRRLAYDWDSNEVWDAIGSLDTAPLHPDRPERPYHFEVLFQPYPVRATPAAWAVLMWKESAQGVPYAGPLLLPPDYACDAIGLLGELEELLQPPLSRSAVELALAELLFMRYKPGRKLPAFPGDVFGHSTLAPGVGTSTEIVVDHTRARDAIATIYEVLETEAARGSYLVGPVVLRFAPSSSALLAMNIHAMNCYIELPSVRSRAALDIYRKCWDALEARAIAFTCHWGQLHGLNRRRVERYFGPRLSAWCEARQQLLAAEEARRVFASPLLAELGI